MVPEAEQGNAVAEEPRPCTSSREMSAKNRDLVASVMTPAQIAEAHGWPERGRGATRLKKLSLIPLNVRS